MGQLLPFCPEGRSCPQSTVCKGCEGELDHFLIGVELVILGFAARLYEACLLFPLLYPGGFFRGFSIRKVKWDGVTSSSGNISISDMQRISEPGLYVVSLVPFNSVGDPGFVIGLARVHDFFSGRDRLPLAVQQPGVSRSAQGKNQGTVFDRFDLEEKVVIRIRLRRELDMADGIRVVFQFDDLSLSGVDEILLLSCSEDVACAEDHCCCDAERQQRNQ